MKHSISAIPLLPIPNRDSENTLRTPMIVRCDNLMKVVPFEITLFYFLNSYNIPPKKNQPLHQISILLVRAFYI